MNLTNPTTGVQNTGDARRRVNVKVAYPTPATCPDLVTGMANGYDFVSDRSAPATATAAT